MAQGDLFDTNFPDARSLQVCFEQMDRLQRAQLPVMYTQGQHEKSRPPYLSLHPWPSHMDSRSDALVCAGGKRYVYGLDHRHADLLGDALAGVPDVDILLCHQVWSDFMGLGVEGCLQQIPHVEVVLTGDLHKHLEKSVIGASGQEMRAFSPGAICMQEISEPAEHFVWLAYSDGAFESHQLKSRYVVDVAIENQEDLERFLSSGLEVCVSPQQGVPEEIAQNIAYVRCREDVPDAYRKVVRALQGKAHLFWKAVKGDEEVVVYEETERDARVRSGLVGCLDLVVPPETAVHKSVSRLLRVENPSAELAVMRGEFGRENP